MRSILSSLLVVTGLLFAGLAVAEPYLAVRAGQKCSACHVNPSGGGKRSAFGVAYGIGELPARLEGDPARAWDGRINDYLALGANLRHEYAYVDVPDQDPSSEFATTRGSLYVEAAVVPGRVTVYADHDFASSQTRELYGLLWDASQRYYLKLGQFFLPFGYRVEDDTALVREASGINMTRADDGLEAGMEQGPWSVHAAISNGAGGGAESDTGKQLSLNAHYVQPAWRIGAGLNRNDGAGDDDRDMLALFGGLRWAGLDWLAELDWIDGLGAPGRSGYAGLLEANWLVRPGHNLKLSLEYLEPDDDVDEDEQNRTSLVWEYAPMQLVQLRTGLRLRDGIPQNPAQNADRLFVQLHAWF